MHTPSKGFTLVEMVFTVLVATILAVVALPSVSSWYERARVDSGIRKIQDSLKFARNQAFSYGATVGVCPLAATGCGSDWNFGLRVYLVKTSNDEVTLKVIDGFNSRDLISGTSIEFSPDGLANSAATFIYCPGGKSTGSQSITLSSSGIIQRGDENQSCG
ncbi:GspH/FimT family pseudopilin [Shewanella khirikhana]|uniref:GspH/FimT family pseudopilin n=1 Tax=Shewanella khirikhana TaxID=1965282 RepID=UPI0030CC3BB8